MLTVLPGDRYDGDDPKGYMTRDEFVEMVEDHVRCNQLAVQAVCLVSGADAIESTFATVRHRTGKTKGYLSRKTGLAMAFKLMMSPQGKWWELDGSNRMPEIIQDIAFVDGIKQIQPAA